MGKKIIKKVDRENQKLNEKTLQKCGYEYSPSHWYKTIEDWTIKAVCSGSDVRFSIFVPDCMEIVYRIYGPEVSHVGEVERMLVRYGKLIDLVHQFVWEE